MGSVERGLERHASHWGVPLLTMPIKDILAPWELSCSLSLSPGLMANWVLVSGASCLPISSLLPTPDSCFSQVNMNNRKDPTVMLQRMFLHNRKFVTLNLLPKYSIEYPHVYSLKPKEADGLCHLESTVFRSTGARPSSYSL